MHFLQFSEDLSYPVSIFRFQLFYSFHLNDKMQWRFVCRKYLPLRCEIVLDGTSKQDEVAAIEKMTGDEVSV